MRVISFLAVAISLLIAQLCFGNDHGSELDKIVINYSKAIESGKFDVAKSFLSVEAKNELKRVGEKSALTSATAAFKKHKGIKNIQITKREVSGNTAKITFVYYLKDGSTSNDFFPFVQEKGKWKITK